LLFYSNIDIQRIGREPKRKEKGEKVGPVGNMKVSTVDNKKEEKIKRKKLKFSFVGKSK